MLPTFAIRCPSSYLPVRRNTAPDHTRWLGLGLGLELDLTAPCSVRSAAVFCQTLICNFCGLTVETAGSCGHRAKELMPEIGKRIANITEDGRETIFLFQGCP